MTTQDIKPGYKQSPLGPIPDNWEIKSLKEIGNFFRGHSYDATNVCDNGLLVIRSSNIQNNGIDIENDLQFVNNECNKNILLQKNDIVICMANGSRELVGKTGKYLGNYTGKITVGAFCAIFRGGNNFSRFIFNSPLYKKYMHFLLAGTNINNLKITDLEKIEIPLPPLPEQEAIAKILGKVDETIEKTQAMIDKIELRNKGLEQKLLTGKTRLKGFNGEFKKLSADKIFKSVSIKNLPDEELLSATQEQGIIPRSMLEGRVTMPTSEAKSYKLVVPGNFVISLRSFQGGLEYSKYRGIVSPAYTVLDHILPICDDYYKYYFKSYDFIGHLSIAVVGIRDGKQISFDDFCTLNLPYPEIEEQKAIANILNKANEQLNKYEQKLEKLQELKKGLMQQLLTGKVRVKEFRN